MPDWTQPMVETFEFYKVDPNSWLDGEKIDTVKACTIDDDEETSTLGGGSFSISEKLNECYIRVYLVTFQNGVKEKHCLGTRLAVPSRPKFNGRSRSIDMDAYTPLIELKENYPPLGYTIMANENIMENAKNLTREHARAPVVPISDEETLYADFVSNTDDTWFTYLNDLISNAGYKFAIDEYGTILYAPEQDPTSLRPRFTFRDSNCSILYPDVSEENDIFGIPNVVEVLYSNGSGWIYGRAVNDDPNSLTSTVNRGREITYRETSPSFAGVPSQEIMDQYAEDLLRNLSSIEHKVTFSHGYVPLRIGDAVGLEYESAGLTGIIGRIVSRSVTCEKGCKVQTVIAYTENLWR